MPKENVTFCPQDLLIFTEPDFLKTLAIALVDFIDLNCYSALQLVLEVCTFQVAN